MLTCITGATGFIGSHLVDLLLARGHRVRALVRRSSNLRWLDGKPVELVTGDVRDPSSLDAFLEGADYVYHLAGVVKSPTRQGYFEGNVHATRHLLDSALRVAPSLQRFVHVSSLTACGPAASLAAPVTEEHPCHPITTYGESKLQAERAVEEMTGKLPWTIVRPPAVFGPRDTEVFIYFQTVSRGLNSMIGFDDKRVSLIHSADLVSGIARAGEAEIARDRIYFISSEDVYAWDQVGRITARVMGRRTVTVRVPHAVVYGIAAVAQGVAGLFGKAATLNIEKARDITRRYWICDTGRAVRELGYRQEMSIEEGIEDTVRWYRDQGWL